MENLNAEQINDILDKMDFFQGQRAGRELWNDKPFDVQEQDIANFSRDVALIKRYIKELTEQNEKLTSLCVSKDIIIADLNKENQRLRADNKELINENVELKHQIQEADIPEEDIDLYDEFTKLLTEGIREAKANTVRKMAERIKLEFYREFDEIIPSIMADRIDQIAKEIENE